MITFENGKHRYFDKHGREITEGCIIRYTDGRTREVYRTNQDELGTDATNPKWIESDIGFDGWKFPISEPQGTCHTDGSSGPVLGL